MLEIIGEQNVQRYTCIRNKTSPEEELPLSWLINDGSGFHGRGILSLRLLELIPMNSNYESLGKRPVLKLETKTMSFI